MKIAIDARFWGVAHTGLGRYTENLVRNLAKIDQKNEYLLFVDQTSEADFSWLPQNFSIQGLKAPHHTLREQWELWHAVQTSDAELIHFPHYIVPLLPFKMPFVVTIHDLIKLKYPGVQSSTLPKVLYLLKRRFFRMSMEKGARKSVFVITDTEAVKKEVTQFFSINSDKIKAIPLGVTIQEQQQAWIPDQVGDDTWMVGDDTWMVGDDTWIVGDDSLEVGDDALKQYLLFVGNAYPYKNVETILRALPLLPQDIFLVLVGARDTFTKRLEDEIKELQLEPRVKLLGFVTDTELSHLYKNAVAFVSMSLEEGFGLQPLEAMVNKCPSILSDIPVFKEVCGDSVLYVDPPTNETGLSESVQNLLNHRELRQTLIQKGQIQLEKYSWAITAEETLRVYEENMQSKVSS